MTNTHKQIVQFDGINHRCQYGHCEREADWRLRSLKTSDIIAAACREHKTLVREFVLKLGLR